jgi:hypothetical protein
MRTKDAGIRNPPVLYRLVLRPSRRWEALFAVKLALSIVPGHKLSAFDIVTSFPGLLAAWLYN